MPLGWRQGGEFVEGNFTTGPGFHRDREKMRGAFSRRDDVSLAPGRDEAIEVTAISAAISGRIMAGGDEKRIESGANPTDSV